MSDVASSFWNEHLATFRGRVAGFERRVRTGPPVADRGIDLRAGKSIGITGWQAVQDRLHARMQRETDLKKSVEKPVEIILVERDWLNVASKYTIADILREVSLQFSVSIEDIRGQRRTAKIIAPRHVAMVLSKHLTKRSLPEIGRKIGGRDHTTVLSAWRKYETTTQAMIDRMPEGSSIRAWVAAFKQEITR